MECENHLVQAEDSDDKIYKPTQRSTIDVPAAISKTKSNAQKCKEYREKKKLNTAKEKKPKSRAKSRAEINKKYYEKNKISNSKSHNEYMKEYRRKKKLEKQSLQLKQIQQQNDNQAQNTDSRNEVEAPSKKLKKDVYFRKREKDKDVCQHSNRNMEASQSEFQAITSLVNQRQKSNERVKSYRDKLKFKKQRAELDSLLLSKEYSLPTEIKKETDHCHDTNSDELNTSQFQMQNKIQLPMMRDAQHFEIKKETDHWNDTNCAELNTSQFQMQIEIQPPLMKEAQHFEIKKETDHCHDTNCAELNTSQFQMQIEIQSPKMRDVQHIEIKKKIDHYHDIKNEAEQVINPSYQSFEVPYEEHDECSMPNALLHRETNIAGDSSCLFSSLIRILNLQVSASELRQQLCDSPYLNACQNPTSARRILSSDFEYGDSDCIFLFSRTYNQNICVHFHFINNNTNREVVRFCYFKVNNSLDFLHLHLRDTHFTPYIVVKEILPHIKTEYHHNEDYLYQNSSDEIKFEKSGAVHFENDESDMEIERSNATNSDYTDYYKHTHAHLEFYHQFHNNTFGHTCAVCDRLWWKNDLKKAPNVDKTLLETIIPNYKSNSSIDVCSTCRVSLERKKIPLLSIYNGFKFPTIPSYLPPLNLIERRLISPRIPFIQIRRVGHSHGQYGQIINVPVEDNTIVKKLPRNIEDDYFYVHVEGKVIHKTSYVQGLINKNHIKEWLKYLVQTPLYVHHEIEIDDEYLNSDQEAPQLVIDDVGEYVPIENNLTIEQQTLLMNADKNLRLAPSEQSVPRSSLSDEYAEELSFPTIYGGQFRNYREGLPVTLFMQANSELRRTDRRSADPQHLLYLAAKFMRMGVTQSVNMAFKHFGSNATITKEQIQSKDYIDHCLQTDLAFLRCIPNSAWYWADRKKDLFAMIRQLGAPTAFMKLSANEAGWINLVKLLYKLKNEDVDVSDQFISSLDYVQKAKLVHEDLVTCAIYFNKLVNCLLKILQYKKRSPFGKNRLLHYFKRIEFHHRGSPEVHILLWLDNAPKNLLSNDKDVIQMIDELVSVSEADASGNIKLQKHKHTSACCIKTDPNQNDSCRFGAPFMPTRNTITLFPMKETDSDFSERKLKEYKKHYKLIRKNLENFEYTDFHHFYTHNNIASDEHYYNIIRAGIDRPKLLYRRKPTEKWHNSFNPFVLHHWKSNVDFQIIQDEYACAAHVVEYVKKHNRGISNLQRQIFHIMDENPEFNIVDIIKKMSTDVLHSVKMSTQEAAWFLLREPMAKSSTANFYIPTTHPSERQRIIVNEVDDDCTDNWFDKYEKRPEELNNVTLAQFVANYYMNKKGIYTKRDTPKIIRYCNYDKADNLNDYRREMVLLHIPFRSEDDDVLADNKFIKIYENNKDLIKERRKEFELNLDVQKTLEICKKICRDADKNEYEDIESNVIYKKDPNEILDRDPLAVVNADA